MGGNGAVTAMVAVMSGDDGDVPSGRAVVAWHVGVYRGDASWGRAARMVVVVSVWLIWMDLRGDAAIESVLESACG